MKRKLATAVVGLGAIGGLAVGANALAAAVPADRAQLTTPVCQRAAESTQRIVSVTAVMRPVAGTKRLEARFELLTKSPASPAYTLVRGGDLGAWVSPTNPSLGTRPGDVWKLNHPVAGLAAPASYRFRVTFRWIGAHHRVLGTITRSGPRCFQPQGPDLLVQSFKVSPIPKHPARDLYQATIANHGGLPAGAFEVELTDGSIVKTGNISGLKAGQTRKLQLTGPACNSSQPPQLVLDPNDAVDDINRANNTATAVCP
jgi:hypothetical protein